MPLIEGYLNLTGVSGDYAFALDSAALSITSDIDVRVKATMADWTPSSTTCLAAKWTTTGNQRSWLLQLVTTGVLQFVWSADGATNVASPSSANPSLTDGTAKWVRVTLDVDNGSSQRVVKFWTSDDGVTWTQLGTTQTASGVTSIFDSTAGQEIGSTTGGTATFGIGSHIHRVQIRSNILDDGTGIVFDAECNKQPNGTTQFVESSTNQATVFLQGNASIVATLPRAQTFVRQAVPLRAHYV